MVPCVTLDGETQMPPLSADSSDFPLMVSDLHFHQTICDWFKK